MQDTGLLLAVYFLYSFLIVVIDFLFKFKHSSYLIFLKNYYILYYDFFYY
jgi:hypothetical protein